MLASIITGIIALIYAGYLLFLKRKPHIDAQSKNYTIHSKLFVLKRICVLIGCVALSALAAWMVSNYRTDAFPTGSKVVLLVDVSKSMLTQDMAENSAPVSRLEAAKIRSLELIQTLKTHPISIVVFAGESRILTPFTLDTQMLRDSIDTISTESVNTGWSDLVEAVSSAFARFDPKEPGVIILMSDGDDRPVDLTALKPQARTFEKVHIMSIGIGGSEPAPLIIGRDLLGNTQYKLSGGKILETKLEPGNLKDISNLTTGEYRDYHESSTIAEGLRSSGDIPEYTPLHIALKIFGILLIIGLILPYRTRWKN